MFLDNETRITHELWEAGFSGPADFNASTGWG